MTRFLFAALLSISAPAFAVTSHSHDAPKARVEGSAPSHVQRHGVHRHDCDDHPSQVVREYVWLRYKQSNLSAPPKVLTKNPGSARGYVDYRVVMTHAKAANIPALSGVWIEPWNYPMVWVDVNNDEHHQAETPTHD